MKNYLFFGLFISLYNYTPLFAQPDLSQEHIGCHHAVQANYLRSKQIVPDWESIQNSNRRSDTIDILNYEIHLDVSNYSGKYIEGFTTVHFKTKLDNIEWIQLDLRALRIDSILYKGKQIYFNRKDSIITAFFGERLSIGTESSLSVYYRGSPVTDPIWGGFYFADNYIYNLGIGLSSIPPNFGKVWFPCFDNFVERSTYDYHITTSADKKAYCVGTFISEDVHPSGKIRRHYSMKTPIPTYLSNIAASNYQVAKSNHPGRYRDIPIELIARSAELPKMQMQFGKLGKAIDAFEFWFGPYRFERVGYVATTVGAMEHPTNVAYPVSSIVSGSLDQNERLYAHELGHHWWGDITTLDDARDMWIKEGTAEYSAHLFVEYAYGKTEFIKAIKNNLSFILFNAHLPNNDGEYLPLSPMPYEHTYGTHTYRKGAAMIHNLRAYLGDSSFRHTTSMIFDSLYGKSMNAYEFRDFLNVHSGKNVTNYFNDFIFNKGYCDFFVDSYNAHTQNGQHFIEITIQQKSHHADHLYTEVPVSVSIYNKNFEKIEVVQYITGDKTSFTVLLPDQFEPAMILLNENQQLNVAHLQSNTKIYKTGTADIGYTGMASVNVTSLKDSAYINIMHHLVEANGNENKASGIDLVSSKHFWEVDVISTEPVTMGCQITYSGSDANGLESDLLFTSEDSLLLIYRKNAKDPWTEYPYYSKIIVNPNDKKGFVRVSNLLPGQYTFGHGGHIVRTKDVLSKSVTLSPNPANNFIKLDILTPDLTLEIIGMHGGVVKVITDSKVGENVIDISDITSGVYEILIKSKSGNHFGSVSFVKE